MCGKHGTALQDHGLHVLSTLCIKLTARTLKPPKFGPGQIFPPPAPFTSTSALPTNHTTGRQEARSKTPPDPSSHTVRTPDGASRQSARRAGVVHWRVRLKPLLLLLQAFSPIATSRL